LWTRVDAGQHSLEIGPGQSFQLLNVAVHRAIMATFLSTQERSVILGKLRKAGKVSHKKFMCLGLGT
jgi:hypothetical protein